MPTPSTKNLPVTVYVQTFGENISLSLKSLYNPRGALHAQSGHAADVRFQRWKVFEMETCFTQFKTNLQYSRVYEERMPLTIQSMEN